MDEILMLHGVERHCPDCDADTIFLPVLTDDGAATDELVCTACDGAVLVSPVSIAGLIGVTLAA
jgi:hypothetical protein